MSRTEAERSAEKTIKDLGTQHRTYSESSGYYASTEILDDVLGPLMDLSEFQGLDVLDLGSGTGRWLGVFHDLGAASITSVEPSPAIEVAKKNAEGLENVSFHNVTGDKMPDGQLRDRKTAKPTTMTNDRTMKTMRQAPSRAVPVPKLGFTREIQSLGVDPNRQ